MKPAYLFKKLDRNIGVSTYTGNFYDLSSDAYNSINLWNEELGSFKSNISTDIANKIGKKYKIPRKILGFFPTQKKQNLFTEKFSSCITDITLNLTSKCNLRCSYCWNDYGKYSNVSFCKKPQSTIIENNENMSKDIAFKAVDLLVQLKGKDKNLVVDFYGGEPLLNTDTLLSTVDYCRKNQRQWGVNFNFLLATNGTLLTKEISERLFKNNVQIAISIDGEKKIHDRNRPFYDKKSSFDVIIKNLKDMPVNIRKRLVGRVTVTPFDSDMVSLYKCLRKLGFERIELFESEDACHKITPNRRKFFFNTEKQHQILCKEYERLSLHYIDEVVNGFLDYKKTFFNRFFKLMQRLYYNVELTGGCPAAKGQIAISTAGDIYPCTSFLGIKRFKLGNVAKGIDNKKYSNFNNESKKRFEYCNSCNIFEICKTTGSCLNVNHYFNSDIAVPYEKGCALFKEKVELSIASLAILSEKIPDRLEELFGFDAAGQRGNKLY